MKDLDTQLKEINDILGFTATQEYMKSLCNKIFDFAKDKKISFEEALVTYK